MQLLTVDDPGPANSLAAEHAIGKGADTTAVAYIETVRGDHNVRWGVGTDANITTASLRAVLAAFERQLD